jgi:hypothetical protein
MRALAHTTPLIRTLEPAAAGACAMILWERSLLCAHTAQTAARFLGLTRPERYYVAGLLHDMGYLVVLQQRPALFSAALECWKQRPAGLLEIEEAIFGASHSEIGRSVARQLQIHPWFYPAIAHHHNPGLDEDQVSRITALSSAFCTWHELDLFPKQLFSANSFSAGSRAREARTREMHDVLRGLFPQILEIDRHRLLDVMSSTAAPIRKQFRVTFEEWFAAGNGRSYPYRYGSGPDSIADVA